MVVILDKKGRSLNISKETKVHFHRKAKSWCAWYWWVLWLFLFWPALLVMLFLTSDIYCCSVNGKYYELEEKEWNRLVGYSDNIITNGG